MVVSGRDVVQSSSDTAKWDVSLKVGSHDSTSEITSTLKGFERPLERSKKENITNAGSAIKILTIVFVTGLPTARALICCKQCTVCIKIDEEPDFLNRIDTLIQNTGDDHEIVEKADLSFSIRMLLKNMKDMSLILSPFKIISLRQ